eukprot:RCo032578
MWDHMRSPPHLPNSIAGRRGDVVPNRAEVGVLRLCHPPVLAVHRRVDQHYAPVRRQSLKTLQDPLSDDRVRRSHRAQNPGVQKEELPVDWGPFRRRSETNRLSGKVECVVNAEDSSVAPKHSEDLLLEQHSVEGNLLRSRAPREITWARGRRHASAQPAQNVEHHPAANAARRVQLHVAHLAPPKALLKLVLGVEVESAPQWGPNISWVEAIHHLGGVSAVPRCGGIGDGNVQPPSLRCFVGRGCAKRKGWVRPWHGLPHGWAYGVRHTEQQLAHIGDSPGQDVQSGPGQEDLQDVCPRIRGTEPPGPGTRVQLVQPHNHNGNPVQPA